MSNTNTNHNASLTTTADDAWSALVDGEVGEHEIGSLLAGFGEHAEIRARWHRYQVIGDVLRGSAPAVSSAPAGDFLADLRTRLEAERPDWQQGPAASGPQGLSPVTGVAADLAARPSANDAVFRWKMLAGFASLAAVMAVSWGVLGSVAPTGAGPRLADAGAAPVVEMVAGPATPAPLVVVPTGQGPIIRDPQLEALMAEHRQHAGMSALQMPAGFLRNATFDAPSR